MDGVNDSNALRPTAQRQRNGALDTPNDANDYHLHYSRQRDPTFMLTSWTNLPENAATILWAVRRLVVCWPGSPCLRAGLIDAYGEDAQGIEHLLRCLVTGIGLHGTRRLCIGSPCCAAVLPDETELLEAIGLDGAESDPSALARLCGSPEGERLAPLASALGSAVAEAASRGRCTVGSMLHAWEPPAAHPL